MAQSKALEPSPMVDVEDILKNLAKHGKTKEVKEQA